MLSTRRSTVTQRWYERAGPVAAVHLARRLVRTSGDLSNAPAVQRGGAKGTRESLYALLHLLSTHGVCEEAVCGSGYMLEALDVWL